MRAIGTIGVMRLGSHTIQVRHQRRFGQNDDSDPKPDDLNRPTPRDANTIGTIGVRHQG